MSADKKKHGKLVGKAQGAEKKAFKEMDKIEYMKAAAHFKESSDFYKEATKVAPSAKKKYIAFSNVHVGQSNYFWAYGLKYYFDDHNYDKAAQCFKNAIVAKKKMFDFEKTLIRKSDKVDKWLIRQEAALYEFHALYYAASGMSAEKKRRFEKAAQLFEKAAENYLKQADAVDRSGRPAPGSRIVAYRLYLRAGGCYRSLGRFDRALQYYSMIIKAHKYPTGKDSSDLKKHLKPTVALAHADTGECYKMQADFEKAIKEYQEFFDWAKGSKLDEEIAEELARAVCIVAAMQVKLGRPDKAEEVVLNFGGQSLAKGVEPIRDNKWYKLASLITKIGKDESEEVISGARQIYGSIDEKDRDPFISSFLEESPKIRKS
ncbi:MAG: tetratricopeptide repeat protein [Candidatus Hodarchaeota archaeon]